ncbi:hypothetical protein ACLB0R_14825 [Sphingomonas sp. GlSt437]|uniref:hypothetical protein n=1 Tax=Sphingomonas sp. GlSt437 TaxID=3389970 RepID=UPI003A89ECE2
MIDTSFYLTIATAGLAALGMVTMAALTGWRGWLQLKQLELSRHGSPFADGPTLPNANARIEIADLKERIRKLEAIAAGVDL